MESDLAVAYVSSYPPRACGIATFTRDLSDAAAQSGRGVITRVAAINEEDASHQYAPRVRWTINQQDPWSWVEAAKQINRSAVSLVCVQHEFGICGRFARDGRFVDHLAGFLDQLEKPVVTTLHTVLPSPRPDLREAIRTLHDRSGAIVTMVNMARLILEQEYGLDPDKLYTIPHGVPSAGRSSTEESKRALALSGRTVLSTFGLLNSGKGIEYMIRALPEVVSKHPEVLYLVIGGTHPVVRRQEGEQYRNSLITLIEELGLQQHVRFVDRYLALPELVRYLTATDIYITPYKDRYQITSGTLAYALGCGKAVVSTPYLYASEALAEGRGVLAEFQNPESFSRCVNLLLENPALRAHCEQNAYEYGRAMSWANVGARYADLFRTVTDTTHYPPQVSTLKDAAAAREERAVPTMREAIASR